MTISSASSGGMCLKAEAARNPYGDGGRGIGVVLSGGGVRSLAQLGVLEVLTRRRIKIEYIGGTSVGAIIAALYAARISFPEICRQIDVWVRTGKFFNDYGFPRVAVVKGLRYNHFLQEVFANHLLEDLPIPCFCAATNLTDECLEILETGPVWRAVRASASLPGILPPVPISGKLYVDGGVLNNLPVDAMRARYDGPILALDASGHVDIARDTRLAETLVEMSRAGGCGVWLSRQFKRRRARSTQIMDIVSRSIAMGGRVNLGHQRSLADICVRLPIERWRMLEFSAAQDIIDSGMKFAERHIDEWPLPICARMD